MQQKNTIIDILTMEKCWKGSFPWWPSWKKNWAKSGIWNGHNFGTNGQIFTNEGLIFLYLWALIDQQEMDNYEYW